jgi:adenine-specific DNA-methyltransferase
MPARKTAAKTARPAATRPATRAPRGTRTQAAAPDGAAVADPARPYLHADAERPLVPEAGAMAAFRRTKPPKEYRYDSSLAPELRWDAGEAAARDRAIALLASVERAESLEAVRAAAAELKAMNLPQLDWAGKAERPRFEVPTLPLFVHERLSTRAVLDSVRDRRADAAQGDLFANPFGDARHGIADQVLRAYEHRDRWTNRMILGDSLVVMNSLLEYEGLGGQVQTIYMDPPYGVKYNSNFQPFVRKREVKDATDADLTREPEMVQAYRDTWELGLHSYLTYLRDRIALSHALLKQEGSMFVQISQDNVHSVRAILDEVFGAVNSVSIIPFKKTTSLTAGELSQNYDFLLWYAKDKSVVKYRQLWLDKGAESDLSFYRYVQLPDGIRRPLAKNEPVSDLPEGSRLFSVSDLTSSHFYAEGKEPFAFQGRVFTPGHRYWSTSPAGLHRLANAGRLHASKNSLRYVRFMADSPVQPLAGTWTDTVTGQFSEERLYVVQTSQKVIQRCVLMTRGCYGLKSM